MDDVGVTSAIEWVVGLIYDPVESRFGRAAALVVASLVALGLLGLIVLAAWYFFLS